MSKFFLYSIVCRTNSHVYIGITSNFSNRSCSHLSTLRFGKNPCKKLQADFAKYGEDSFDLSIIEKFDKRSDAARAENRLIEMAMAEKKSYNTILSKNFHRLDRTEFNIRYAFSSSQKMSDWIQEGAKNMSGSEASFIRTSLAKVMNMETKNVG